MAERKAHLLHDAEDLEEHGCPRACHERGPVPLLLVASALTALVWVVGVQAHGSVFSREEREKQELIEARTRERAAVSLPGERDEEGGADVTATTRDGQTPLHYW